MMIATKIGEVIHLNVVVGFPSILARCMKFNPATNKLTQNGCQAVKLAFIGSGEVPIT